MSDAETTPVVLDAKDLVKTYQRSGSTVGRGRARRVAVHAVDGVSLSLRAGVVTALVGESGSGKSTISRMLSLLEWPTAGTIELNGEPVVSGRASALLRSRVQRRVSSDVQLVMQDPFASLNGHHLVGYHIERPLRIHGKDATPVHVAALLEQVNLRPGTDFAGRYPHELSGGQRQRVAIARALAADPSVLLADEPISMLDVSVRLGVLSLLDDLRRERNLAVLYITHDLASVGYFADEALVMYAGSLVEGGPSTEVISRPAHPYTQLLRRAAPDPDRAVAEALGDVGEPPDLAAPPSGCRFHPRCPHAMPICSTERPPALPTGDGHWANCWLYGSPGDEMPTAGSTQGGASSSDRSA